MLYIIIRTGKIILQNINLYEYNKNKENYYKILVDTSLIHKQDWIYDFYLNQDTLVLLLFGKILICKKDDNNFLATKKIYLKSPAHYLDYYNGKYHFYYAGVFQQRYGMTKPSTYQIIYDKNFSKDSLHNYELPSGLIWSLIRPRKLIAFKNDLLLVSDADNYHLRIYDGNDKIIWDTTLNQSIIRTKNVNWSEKEFNELIDGMQSSNLIRTVDFLDTNRILVAWTHPNKKGNNRGLYALMFDVWYKNNGKWELQYDSLESIEKIKNSRFEYKNEFLDRFTVSGSRVISINPIPFKVQANTILKNHEVDSLAKEYFYTKGPRYSIIIRKVK